MREIKFRGKQTKPIESIWHYGDLMHSKDNKTYIQNITCIEVDKKTIGQFTGLKDKNGKEIYEGDIVNMHYFFGNCDSATLGKFEDEMEVCGVIRISEYGVYLETKNKEIYYLVIYVQEPSEELEVIGNIHDNPELLKESD